MILINGRSLVEIIRDVELPYATQEGSPEIAGTYLELPPAEVLPELLRSHPKANLLGCTCGNYGCWPLQAEIEFGPEVVVWDRFCQPHRGPAKPANLQWRYDGVRFTFDRAEYEAQVKALL